MDHDRLNVLLAAGSFCRARAKARPFGRFIGLEPLVESLMGDLQGSCQSGPSRRLVVGIPGRTEGSRRCRAAVPTAIGIEEAYRP